MADRRQESGFALLFVFALAAGIAVMLYMQLPRAAFEAQRMREQMLIDRGEQYKRAIQLFVAKNRRYPATMDELEKMGSVRFLRRRYKDPMTGEDEWRIIRVDSTGRLIDSKVQKAEGEKKDQYQNTFISEGPAIGSTPATTGAAGGANVVLRRRPSDSMPIGTGEVPPAPEQQPGTQTPVPPGMQMQPGLPGQMQSGLQGQLQPVPPGGMLQGQLNPQQPGQPMQPGQIPLQGQAYPGQPGAQGQPAYPGQPFPGQTGAPGQPVYPVYPGQPLPGQPGAQGQPVYPGQPQPGYPAQPYPVQPGAQPGMIPQMGLPGQPQIQGAMMPGQTYPQNPAQQLGRPAPGYVAGNAAMPDNPALRAVMGQIYGPRPQGAPQPGTAAAPGGQQIGGGIAGVASKLEADSIKVYNEREKYDEWEFIYDFSKDRRRGGAIGQGQQGQGARPNQPNTPGTPGPQQPPPAKP
ncbi:MAG TPA: hypothetical protein VFL57_07210 [Bryobacteraceae bacterium]|nr:hypothetical protein [Bryobacteraceae bacterium]